MFSTPHFSLLQNLKKTPFHTQQTNGPGVNSDLYLRFVHRLES
jgi:hypothetical protein